MLIGHYGVAFALTATDKNKKISLGLFFLAVNLPDIIWGVLLAAGVEKTLLVPGFTKWVPLQAVYTPISHGLMSNILWSFLVFILFSLLRVTGLKSIMDKRTALILGLAVLSHIICDIVVHAPDIPIAGMESFKLGLGLWNFPIISNVIEIGLFTGGVILYLRSTNRFKNRKAFPVIAFAAGMLIYHFANGLIPPQPEMSIKIIGASYAAMVLVFSGIAAWIDRDQI